MIRFVAPACGLAALLSPSIVLGQSITREPTDIRIRQAAGLSPASARGQIELIDVGHDPLDTMISIVGNRSKAGWKVSYACAMSPRCATDADHSAQSYTLSTTKSAEVDRIIEQLRIGVEPVAQQSPTGVIGGYLHVRVNTPNFHREYNRQVSWGKTLGSLETLLQPPDP